MLDSIGDFFSDAWDNFVDGIQEIPEFVSGLFENFWEFSVPGLIGGGVMVFLTHMVLKKLVYFTQLSGGGKVIQSIIFYVFAFVLGYILVKRGFDM